MATTCKLIAKTTLGSNTTTVTLGSGGTIPQTYDDLVLIVSSRTSTSDVSNPWKTITMLFNGSTSNRSHRDVAGNGSSASSATSAILQFYTASNNATANVFGSAEIYIPNYTRSVNKSVSVSAVTENNATASVIAAGALLWADTSAITSISLSPNISGDFVSGSSFFLYGITKA